MNLAWVKTKEMLDSSLGIIGVFLGIWGLVLNWNSAVFTGACLILASHIFVKIWWLRFIVSSDCFQRKFSDTITNFLKGLPGYAAFFTSGTTVEAS